MVSFLMCCIPKGTDMDIDEALTWLYGFTSRGSKLGLDRITQLLDRLENPHQNISCVHVTGTNGKGSVCHFLGSILASAGYKTGVYLSPHLQRFNERVLINEKEISDTNLIALVQKIQPVVQRLEKEGCEPTFFELVTALAFLYFNEQHVDVAVIEVGLGGRYDATNVIHPLASVITNISVEHADILGKTLQEIAFEKAGIIKPQTPVVTAAVSPAFETINDVAAKQQAPVIHVTKQWWQRQETNTVHQTFRIHTPQQTYEVTTHQLGEFQGENISCAIAAAELLQTQKWHISNTDIQQGIATAFNPGRMEFFTFPSKILIDGAHNPTGMQNLAHSLQQDFSYPRLHLILSILRDKDIPAMLSQVTPLADAITVTQSTNPRACSPEMLKQFVEDSGYTEPITVKQTIAEALKDAIKHASDDELLVVTGSLFTVGEARDYLQRLKVTSSVSSPAQQ